MSTTSDSSRDLSASAALRLFWLVPLLLIPLGIFSGVAYASSRPVVYTGEARLAVGAGEMSTLAIPGFPTASRDLAANYARWVNNTGIAGTGVPAGVTGIGAAPVADSNVIRIQAWSYDSAKAKAGAKTMADALVSKVNELRIDFDAAEVLKQIRANAPALSLAQANANRANWRLQKAVNEDAAESTIASLTKAYQAADSTRARLAIVQDGRNATYSRLISQKTTEADLKLIREASVVGDDRSSTQQRSILIGGGAGFVLALAIIALLNARRTRAARRVAAQRVAADTAPVAAAGVSGE